MEWVKNKIEKHKHICTLCGKALKLVGYDYNDKDQFSIDRKDNKVAHIKSNCQIICWNCNIKKKTLIMLLY